MGRRFVTAGRVGRGIAVAFLAAPASALGADTYVDVDTGSDANPCTQPQPCQTIQKGIDTASAGDTVRVDPDTYPLAIQIGDGKSVIAEEFVGGPEGTATIDGGASTAIDVAASGAATVSGFTITSTASPMVALAGPVNLSGNSLVVPTSNAVGIELTAGVAGLVTIADNEFAGDNASSQTAIRVRNGSEASVTGNRIGSPGSGFLTGVLVFEGASAEIARNVVRALFSVGSAGGQAISVQDATAVIADNLVTDVQPLPATVWGIQIIDTATAPVASATLQRNQLYGGGALDGIRILDAAPVTMEGDLVTGFDVGIRAQDVFAANTTNANVDATGLTTFGNTTADVSLDSSTLNLDSSIIGSNIVTTGTGIGGGAVGCTITFSRGPAMTPGGNGCADFQTSADPAFVDPSPLFGEPNLHLTPGSPMIDAGNPLTPPAGALDIDGDLRAVSGISSCTAPDPGPRDIGADEYVAPRLDCSPPASPSASNAFSFAGKPRLNKRKGTATLTIDVPGAGTLVLSGNGIAGQSATAARVRSAASRVTLTVRSKGKKRRALNRNGKVKVVANVTYTPTGGSANTQSQRIKLIKRP